MIQLLNIAGLGPIFGALSGALWGSCCVPVDHFRYHFRRCCPRLFLRYDERAQQRCLHLRDLRHLSGRLHEERHACVQRCAADHGRYRVRRGPCWPDRYPVQERRLQRYRHHHAVLADSDPDLFLRCHLPVHRQDHRQDLSPLRDLPDHHGSGRDYRYLCQAWYTIPELWDNFRSMHPSGTPVWSFMFITVACGAISGFHATQSP